MFRRTGGDWYYYIPEELEPGLWLNTMLRS